MAKIVLLNIVEDAEIHETGKVLIPDAETDENIIFSEGDATDAAVELNMAEGDQVIEAPEGVLYKNLTVKKPDTLIPANIVKGINIGGVEGESTGGAGVSKEVALELAEGNQVVISEDGTLMDKVTILKPVNLAPENIIEGVDIAGVIGAYAAPKLLAPTAIYKYTNANNLTYIQVTNPSGNGSFVEKIQLIANHETLGKIVIAEKEVTGTGNISVFATDTVYEKGVALANAIARFVGSGFTPSDEFKSDVYYHITPINFVLIGVSISPEYNFAFLEDILTMQITEDEEYYLPKTIDILDAEGKTSNKVYSYDYDTGILIIEFSKTDITDAGLAISIIINAVQTPWLRIPEVTLDEVLQYLIVEYIDENAESTIVTLNGTDILSIEDTREGLTAYEVTEKATGASYGFTLQDDGYYKESSNGGTYRVALCRIDFDMVTEGTVTLEYVHYGYSSTTYGIISNIDCKLSTSYSTDIDTSSENVYTNFKSSNSTTAKTIDITVPKGQHFIYIKFRRYSTSSSSYYFKFRVTTEVSVNTTYSLLDFTTEYGTYPLQIQSHATGYDSSDILAIDYVYKPIINVSNGVLTIQNTVPTNVTEFEIYVNDELIATVAYDHTSEWSVQFQDYIDNINVCNIYVVATGSGSSMASDVISARPAPDSAIPIYGVSGLFESAPELTRTDNATEMTYTINDDGNIDSDFNNVFPWNETELVTDDYGNKFVKFPRMYFRVGIDDSDGNGIGAITDVAVSAIPHDEGSWYEVSPFMMGRYLGYVDVDGGFDKLRSIAGYDPITNITRAKHRTYAKNNGEGYHQLDVYHYTVLLFLWWVEWATKDSQSIMTGATKKSYTGDTDTLSTPSGYITSSNQMRYHYIEDFVGRYQQYLDGTYMNMSTTYATSNPDNYVDSSSGMFSLGYASSGTTSATYCLKGLGWNSEYPFLCLPYGNVTNTSYDTYMCDSIQVLSSYGYAYVGAYHGLSDDVKYGVTKYGYTTSTSTYLTSRLVKRLE